jgi:hypothetical protein
MVGGALVRHLAWSWHSRLTHAVSEPWNRIGRVALSRGNLRTAEDALTASRGAKQLLDDELLTARRAAGLAEAAVRSAALRVLAAETLEDLIESAINARAAYLESVAGLGWLIRNHGVPSGDARAHQLVLEADSAPARWRPEATYADGGMAKRLAALMEGDHP